MQPLPIVVALLLPACQGTPPPHPSSEASTATIGIDVGARWKLVHERADSIAVRLGDTAHGVRVDLHGTAGVTPIAGGRSPARALGTPLLTLPYPATEIRAVTVVEQDIDLVIRISGPPLNTLTTDPRAPSDPVLTWVRVRDRGDTWRVSVEGLARWNLPQPIRVTHADRDGVIVSTEDWGSWLLTSNAPASRTTQGEVWTFDPTPSLDAKEPYPVTAATWSDTRL